MGILSEKKRKWVIQQFQAGRSATSIARIQKISRQHVYRLAARFKRDGMSVIIARKVGRKPQVINARFAAEVVELRKHADYGSVKLHVVLSRKGFRVSQRQIQKVLDVYGLTEPCVKRRGQRKYVRYQWPIANYMWHCDWSDYQGRWYISFTDDRSRRIMSAGKFSNATEENAIFTLYQGILSNEVCPVVMLSDKGTQFYNSTRNKKGERPPSLFKQVLEKLGIKYWTSRRQHPQTNGKQEKWFDYMKKRMKKHPEDSLQEVVRFYNEERIHDALDNKTPDEVYRDTV